MWDSSPRANFAVLLQVVQCQQVQRRTPKKTPRGLRGFKPNDIFGSRDFVIFRGMPRRRKARQIPVRYTRIPDSISSLSPPSTFKIPRIVSMAQQKMGLKSGSDILEEASKMGDLFCLYSAEEMEKASQKRSRARRSGNRSRIPDIPNILRATPAPRHGSQNPKTPTRNRGAKLKTVFSSFSRHPLGHSATQNTSFYKRDPPKNA